MCDERATKPAVKRPSESVHVILNSLPSGDDPKGSFIRGKKSPSPAVIEALPETGNSKSEEPVNPGTVELR